MSPIETAKQRAKRIDPRVLRGPRWLERGRTRLALLATLLALGWWGAGMLVRRADAWVSPGPVAAVHATWANDCQACHTEFQPIRADALLASREARTAVDQKCQKCHPVAHADHDPLGPFGHHAVSGEIAQLDCASCHREHQGSTAHLTRTSDTDCKSCHARTDLVKLSAQPPNAADTLLLTDLKRVTGFSADGHPDFRSLKEPVQRNLKFAKFSHHVHMTPGMAYDGNHKPLLTVGQLSPADQKIWTPNQKSEELVKLNCSSCHQSESRKSYGLGEKPGPDAEPQAEPAGALMMPIVYERHCQACHSLTVEANIAGEKGESIPASQLSPEGKRSLVRHRLTTDQLRTEIQAYWNDRFVKDNPQQLDRARPVPGHALEALDATGTEFLERGNQNSALHLSHVCAKCHRVEDTKGSSGKFIDDTIPRVLPVNIASPILVHARFNHASHRATDCRECHQDAYAKGPETNANEEAKSPLMIVKQQKCLECHSPLQENAAAPHGGARFDCAECHRYHNRQDTATIQALSKPPTDYQSR